MRRVESTDQNGLKIVSWIGQESFVKDMLHAALRQVVNSAVQRRACHRRNGKVPRRVRDQNHLPIAASNLPRSVVKLTTRAQGELVMPPRLCPLVGSGTILVSEHWKARAR